MTLKYFREIFNRDFNLGFHVPKKDQCEVCVAQRLGRELSADYEAHISEKEMARAQKAEDKAKGLIDPSFKCAVYDLQAVLQCPSGDLR